MQRSTSAGPPEPVSLVDLLADMGDTGGVLERWRLLGDGAIERFVLFPAPGAALLLEADARLLRSSTRGFFCLGDEVLSSPFLSQGGMKYLRDSRMSSGVGGAGSSLLPHTPQMASLEVVDNFAKDVKPHRPHQ